MKHKIFHSALALLVLSLLVAAPRAQQPAKPSDDRIALYQALLDLQNPWTVMCVAAHPDDEDGTSLIVMRRKYGAHTVSLFSTLAKADRTRLDRNCTKRWARFARVKRWPLLRSRAQSRTFSG
jgi:hypothetical protein